MGRHKYIEEIKKKYADNKDSHNIVNPSTLDLVNDPRMPRFHGQKRKYGFDERETWALNYTFYCWLYEHLRMFKDVATLIDLTFHKFEYEGEELTQLECIDRIIEGCELYIAFDDSGWGWEKMSDETKKKIKDVIPLWGLVLPAMWW